MKKAFKQYITYLSIVTTIFFSPKLFASDYNLPFVNTSGLGNLYSGWATEANDASTMATNPAGLTKIQNKQFVASGIGLFGSAKFSGSANTIPTLSANETGTASTKLRGFLPALYYAMPKNNFVWGIGVNIPFALGTNYAKDSIVRYAATRTQIVVFDFMPAIGFKLSNKLAAGIGLDIDRMAFTVNHMYGFPFSTPDSELQNHLSGWGYGFHAGLLYDWTEATRVGINYNSQIMIHTTGDSKVFSTTSTVRTTNQKASAALPTLTQLSIQHQINNRWTIMGTLFYTHWSSFKQLTLKNTMLPSGSTFALTIPFEYHDTFDYSIGTNFAATEKLTLRAGLEYLNTPSNDHDRSPPDPIGAATIVAIGGHYQQNKQIGYDFGYGHSFFKQTKINYLTPIAFATGHSTQNSNVLGIQLTWNMV
jgi:long-chain fatty acid transport protein